MVANVPANTPTIMPAKRRKSLPSDGPAAICQMLVPIAGSTISPAACAGGMTMLRRPITTVGSPMPSVPLTKPAKRKARPTKRSRAASIALGARWRRGDERWPRREALEPVDELRMAASPVEIRIARFHAERAAKRELRHVEAAAHGFMPDAALPQVRHPPGALGFMVDDAGRALVRGTSELAAPHREAVHQAARQGFQAARFPR